MTPIQQKESNEEIARKVAASAESSMDYKYAIRKRIEEALDAKDAEAKSHLERVEGELAKLKEAVLEAHPDGFLVKRGEFQGEFDFVESVKWLGKEWGAAMMHECEQQDIIFDDDGVERELEYVVGDGPEYGGHDGYTTKEPHPELSSLRQKLDKAVAGLREILRHTEEYGQHKVLLSNEMAIHTVATETLAILKGEA